MKEENERKKCPACGRDLPAKRRRHRKYCDAACRMQVYRLGVKIEAAQRRREARPAKVDVVETVIALVNRSAADAVEIASPLSLYRRSCSTKWLTFITQTLRTPINSRTRLWRETPPLPGNLLNRTPRQQR